MAILNCHVAVYKFGYSGKKRSLQLQRISGLLQSRKFEKVKGNNIVCKKEILYIIDKVFLLVFFITFVIILISSIYHSSHLYGIRWYQSEKSQNFNFLKINFYATLRYAEKDSEIYFSEKISKYIKFVC